MTLRLFTSRIAVDAVYGAGAYDELLEAVQQYAVALEPLGLECHLLAPDHDAIAALWGVPRITSPDAGSLARSIYTARARFNKITAVLLLGGPDVIPHFRLDSLTADDGDQVIPSDNPYGTKSGDAANFAAPVIPVGRIAGARGGGIEDLIAHLQRMRDQHVPARCAPAAAP